MLPTISSYTFFASGCACARCASVYAFSASRCATIDGSFRSSSRSQKRSSSRSTGGSMGFAPRFSPSTMPKRTLCGTRLATGGTGGDVEAEAAPAQPLPRRMMARAATAAPIAMGATFTMFTIAACVPECSSPFTPLQLDPLLVVLHHQPLSLTTDHPPPDDGDDDGAAPAAPISAPPPVRTLHPFLEDPPSPPRAASTSCPSLMASLAAESLGAGLGSGISRSPPTSSSSSRRRRSTGTSMAYFIAHSSFVETSLSSSEAPLSAGADASIASLASTSSRRSLRPSQRQHPGLVYNTRRAGEFVSADGDDEAAAASAARARARLPADGHDRGRSGR
mmetsp:Transcript_8968/g.36657  ORF Transcript_8968/g.36657 Transcript_8968/m.36657 type:complete len:336 (-) Transcript_8968:93-1100(-)